MSRKLVSYGYDSIYRLTSETIASDPNNVNGAASYVYDAVGNRTLKTSTIPGFPGGLTNYNASHTQTSYYVYDGHGSTRALTDPNGAVTDTYDYDAFGNLIHSSFTGIPPGGTTAAPTPNEFLFAGEQFDSDLNLYYNRARYLNTSTGRFWTMDDHEGDDEDPLTLHKYTYAGNEPTDRTDPSGYDFDLASALGALTVAAVITSISVPSFNEFEPGGSAEPRVATTQSVRGEKFLECHEGDAHCDPILHAYDNDGSKTGNCTIGWGHKIEDGPCTD